MSTNLAHALPAPAPERELEPRRHLEVAPSRAQRRARPRIVYALVTVGGIGVILLAQLLLSIVAAEGAYEISALQAEQRDLVRTQQDLAESAETWSSTQNLIRNAEKLGMVASGNPVFLDLATGKVSGTPTPAGGSLTDGRNRIGNSLIDASMVVDPKALERAESRESGASTSEGESARSEQRENVSSGSSREGGDTTLPSPTTR
ncbi:hypothetical protein [Homoserinibacter sp. YIM 151385]|uniref:hypothetical protein n=1 Tax=Homoserinibacter sp. YIM 151385 TaxID=2985506 RepID=UPI0022F0BF98|nr:hypothetical protein [Homoserinibacter sp. YIM 151385]WBU38746.1 hypothetical protein OF852_03965 [Homoserinibacter sp. YIM 151385]